METLPLALQAFDTEIELAHRRRDHQKRRVSDCKKHVMQSMIFAQKDPKEYGN